MTPRATILAGLGAVMLLVGVWHGPLGTAERMAAAIEADARRQLDRLEMPQVAARLDRAPLRRTLILSGPADPFQRSELVRILDELHGVAQVRWDPAAPVRAPRRTPPTAAASATPPASATPASSRAGER